ncbi:hypothetical protein D3C81_1019790 [compost metagenome]
MGSQISGRRWPAIPNAAVLFGLRWPFERTRGFNTHEIHSQSVTAARRGYCTQAVVSRKYAKWSMSRSAGRLATISMPSVAFLHGATIPRARIASRAAPATPSAVLVKIAHRLCLLNQEGISYTSCNRNRLSSGFQIDDPSFNHCGVRCAGLCHFTKL